jgi:hypothetical protein
VELKSLALQSDALSIYCEKYTELSRGREIYALNWSQPDAMEQVFCVFSQRLHLALASYMLELAHLLQFTLGSKH